MICAVAWFAYVCVHVPAGTVFCYYGAPYLFVNAMLVQLTYLQAHRNPAPISRAASTVRRDVIPHTDTYHARRRHLRVLCYVIVGSIDYPERGGLRRPISYLGARRQ